MTSRFIVGIDLGTTNSAVAFVDTASLHPKVQIFRIPQLGELGIMESLPMLPSFYYLAAAGEFPKGSLTLPWSSEEPDFIVGAYARSHGAKVPTRLVHSAKSWLSNSAASRREKILPFDDEGSLERQISPVEASVSFLRHICEAWNSLMAKKDPSLCLEEQEIVLTVPASFDEIARTLTAEAAAAAGLKHMTLLEEPQSAFYTWLMEHEGEREKIKEGDVIVVCDCGGGTTDFSLLLATASGFQRTAVGKHLLLGGDNMDMAICKYLERKLQLASLDRAQMLSLYHQARTAKERLLSGGHKASSFSFWIPGKGSQVIGGGISLEITFGEIQNLLLDGFFGMYSYEEALQLKKGSGVRSMGLPYESEPSITKHLAYFLSAGNLKEKPHWLLLNGGALKPHLFQERLLACLNHWYPQGQPSSLLSSSNLDLAVAKGAAYFGLARRGFGLRVSAGLPRAYYLGVDVPGEEKKHALTILARGSEEGIRYIPEQQFTALSNKAVSFQLYHSHTRLGDAPGSLVPVTEELMPLAPIQTVLRYGKQKETALPVKLEVHLTEIGTLELWLIAQQSEHRWELQFQLRGQDFSDVVEKERAFDETFDAKDLDEAKRKVVETFSVGHKSNLKSLISQMEVLLERPKAKWPPSLLRTLFDVLILQASKRTLSDDYGERFWNSAGFFLRPGKGYPLDDFRIKELWKCILADMNHETSIHQAICYRRIASGLSKGQQTQLFNAILPLVYDKKRGQLIVKGKRGHYAYSEYIRTLSAFELVDLPLKLKIAEPLLLRIEQGDGEAADYWALGRIGARVLLHGSIGNAIPRGICEKWILRLIKAPAARTPFLPFLLTLLARKTDYEGLNLSNAILAQVSHCLESYPEAVEKDLDALLMHERSLSFQEQEYFFGDTLPAGISL